MHFFTSKLLFIITVFLLSGGIQTAPAQKTDKTVFRFLNLPTSARASALGGNHVSLNDASVSLFQLNPAYLSNDDHRKLFTSYLNHLSDVNLGFLSGAYHINSIGTAALGIRYVNYGQIDKKNERGERLGTFTPTDLALSLGLGRSASNHFTYGISLDLIYSGYDVYRSTGLGLSGGALYTDSEEQFSVGAVIRNVGYQISSYAGTRESLPFNLSVAVSKRLEHSPFRLNLTVQNLQNWNLYTANDAQTVSLTNKIMRHIVFGGELIISDNVHARIGYNHYKHEQLKTGNRIDLAGFSYGIGVTVRDIQFDFSRSSYSSMGGLTQISVQTSL